MEKLNSKDYENVKKIVSIDRNINNSSFTKKMLKLLQERHDREFSIIKKEYPNLSDDEIVNVLGDYREYTDLIDSIYIFMDFPSNYMDSNISNFLTEDDIEDLQIAIEEMMDFVEGWEEKIKKLKNVCDLYGKNIRLGENNNIIKFHKGDD
ncbi:pathogenicity island protein [Staphylococcus pettenkoferi]|uniref:pathogenicity island protein n=1 Tax=Staphylococcus pettenkoferi TaxID=170573 RepID=UPI0030B81BE3